MIDYQFKYINVKLKLTASNTQLDYFKERLKFMTEQYDNLLDYFNDKYPDEVEKFLEV